MPTFGSKASADEVKLATDNAREKEKELLSQFNVAPITLEDVDRNIGSFLQSCITNEVYARKLFEECKQSGRAMLVELHNRKAGVSDKSKKKLLRDLETFAENGLSAPTVEAFNEFINDFVLINENLKKPKPASELEEYYLDAAREALGTVNSAQVGCQSLRHRRTGRKPKTWGGVLCCTVVGVAGVWWLGGRVGFVPSLVDLPPDVYRSTHCCRAVPMARTACDTLYT